MERAYPIVYRCTIKIVAGDDKQLKPTSFFANRAENESQNYEYADNDKCVMWKYAHEHDIPERAAECNLQAVHRDILENNEI